MTGRFDYFVVLAGMRTGSNLLEEYLAAMPGLRSYGELFNPHFFGRPKVSEQFGLTMSARDEDPIRVLNEMRKDGAGLPGFRLFHDHDSRVVNHVLRDPRAAKIVLTRRPIDSYVSLLIARKTGQWWLGDLASARSAKVTFNGQEYADFLNELGAFQDQISRELQVTGQTAFPIDYADLSDIEVIAGLGRFLGADGSPDMTKVRAKVQNPTPLADRLSNPEEAERTLRDLEISDLGYLPSHEPERGPGLRMFHACRNAPILYMPIRGAGRDPVPEWLRSVDPNGEVDTGMTQKDLRRWMRDRPGHRSFTILRHPLPRAYDAFCRFILPPDIDSHADIRDALVSRYDVDLPGNGWNSSDWTVNRHAKAFLGFLKFLKGNLGGQTSLRVDHSWASQSAFLSAIAGFAVPDRIVREEEADTELSRMPGVSGDATLSTLSEGFSGDWRIALEDIRTEEIDTACRDAYRRDYVFFGFDAWAEEDQAARAFGASVSSV